MKFTLLLSTLVIASQTVTAGTLQGTMSYQGPAPKVEFISTKTDPACQKGNGGKPLAKGDILVEDGKLANVFIYLKTGVKPEAAKKLPPLVFDQKGCDYTPRVFGIRTGQTLKILNSDATFHNVRTASKANPAFNVGMPTQGMTLEKKFAKPEIMVPIHCDIHSWMIAYAGIVDHPYFAVSDAKGNFKIEHIPAGEYTVEAWHEKLGTQTKTLKVADDKPAQLDLTFNAK